MVQRRSESKNGPASKQKARNLNPKTVSNADKQENGGKRSSQDVQRYVANVQRQTDLLNNLCETIENQAQNALMRRRESYSGLIDPRKNIDDECGYPPIQSPVNEELYQQLYDRMGIATRVIELFADESWRVQPSVYESEDEDVTQFEMAFNKITSNLQGMDSVFEEEENNAIWSYLHRADVQSGIGQYGALLMGIDDGLELSQPAVMSRNKVTTDQPPSSKKGRREAGITQQRELIYLRTLPHSLVRINTFETDRNNPRYSLPTTYRVSFEESRSREASVMGENFRTEDVHWSRIIHITDNITSNEVYGVPRLKPVLNWILDLYKTYAASAEGYWNQAFPGLALETIPALGGDVEVDESDLKDQMENYSTSLQRFLILSGITAKTISPVVSDATGEIMAKLQAIAIRLGVPMRILMGSERGELSSGQDASAWDDRVNHRRKFQVSTHIIKPFVDRSIQLGVLPRPAKAVCKWPDLKEDSKQDKATIAESVTRSLSQYVTSDIESIMPVGTYLTKIQGMDQTEVDAIMEDLEEDRREQDKLESSLSLDDGIEDVNEKI